MFFVVILTGTKFTFLFLLRLYVCLNTSGYVSLVERCVSLAKRASEEVLPLRDALSLPFGIFLTLPRLPVLSM